jgi:predicted lipid-binding transport protein (Tim44 family)
MLRRLALAAVLTSLSIAVSLPDAEARRMGGGKSFGRQSSGAMQQHAQQPPSREAIGQPAQQSAQPVQPAPAAQQQGRPAAGNRWLGPLAGLAAGLGIAALLSHLGLAGPFASMLGSLLIVALLALGALFVWRMLRGAAPATARRSMEPAYGGGPSGPVEIDRGVGQDLPSPAGAARPGSLAATLSGGPLGAASSTLARAPGVPADFDTEAFLRNAKVHFHRLQSAWDRKDVQDIGAFTTPEVFGEIRMQLSEQQEGSDYTEVVTLQADLLGIEESTEDYLASVRFVGSIRESQGATPVPFQEIWNLVKRKDGTSGWLLAGMQQIQ